jgi:hypothetical protein
MSRLLRHLIVIISLLPSCLCFAQESANKTPSSSSAQKPEAELQKPDSVPVKNPPAELPPAVRGLFSAIRKVELPPEANAWAVQIVSRGGITGRGRGDLTITSHGDLVWKAVENQCNVKLQDDVKQMLTQTAFSANAPGWGRPTASYCSDCFVYAMVLQRREHDGIERTYVAYWDDTTAKNISEELRKVYDTFMTYKGCRQ